MEHDLNLITIYDKEENEVNMSALGLTGLKLVIPSPSYRTTTEEVDGMSGILVLDRVLNSRSLTGVFFSQATDYKDSLTVRDNLYAYFGNGQAIYVAENQNPLRRWHVEIEDWTPERLDLRHHSFEIPLFAKSGCSESITPITETFNEHIFKFKNEGSVTIDPRKHLETELTFTGVSSNLIIRNKTTGEEWSWKGTTESSDTILLKGVRSFKNGTSIYKDTNKKLITIPPGWNHFEVIGATGEFELTIKSRFYFL